MVQISTISKFNKRENNKLGAHLLAVQEIIRKILASTIDTLIATKLLTIKKSSGELTYEHLSYLKVEIAESIIKEEELKIALSNCVSTEGVGKGIDINQEAINDFYDKLFQKTDEEFITKILSGFDQKVENLSSLTEGARIAVSIIEGEEYKVD